MVMRNNNFQMKMKLFEDKRVTFVGLCPNIKNMAMGEEIDGFDIV